MEKENSKQVKCPKCGFMNIKGTKKCTKCHHSIDSLRKSCPKCGKINSSSVRYCIDCKYDFEKKRRSIWFNIVISVFIVIVLCLLVFFGKESIVKKFNLGLSVLAGFALFVLLIRMFFSDSKQVVNYSAEEEMQDNNDAIVKMKKISNIAIVIGGILVLGFLIYYYFIK